MEDVCEGEWADWYALTPLERWRQSLLLFEAFLAMGGSALAELQASRIAVRGS